MAETLRGMIYKSFSKMPEKKRVEMKAEELVPVNVGAPIKVEKPKSVGDVTISAQAQRIYNPNMPPAPPKAPTAAQSEQGTGPAMDLASKWDKGNG